MKHTNIFGTRRTRVVRLRRLSNLLNQAFSPKFLVLCHLKELPRLRVSTRNEVSRTTRRQLVVFVTMVVKNVDTPINGRRLS